MKDRRALAILTLLFLITTLPFVNRAYFVDDFYFVTMAKGILEHPLRPYDFVSDDAGIGNVAWERGQQPRMVNPPLFHYFLAGVIKLWGDAVWKLRTASLLFSLISLYAMYFLGKRFVRDPLPAATLMAITPAFWLTSYSLLIDSALLAFCLAALVLFIEGQEKGRWGWVIASGALMGAALLTKYTGVLILPVVLIWHLLNPKSCTWQRTASALAVCAVIFALWGIWGVLTYGQPHFTATLSRGFHSTTSVGLVCLGLGILGFLIRYQITSYRKAAVLSWACWVPAMVLMLSAMTASGSLGGWMQVFYLDKLIAVASFLGGTTVFLFWAPALLWIRRRREAAGVGGAAVLLFLCFNSRYGGFDVLQSVMLSFFIGSTLAFFLAAVFESSFRKDRNAQFLLIWLGLSLLELILVMPWTAARYLLLSLPPACWLCYRLFEVSGRLKMWRWAWGFTAVMGGALAYVDYAQAQAIVRTAAILEAQRPLFQTLAPQPKHHWYYLSDTFDGSQPYVRPWGWENVFPSQVFPSGSLFLKPVYRRSSWWAVSQPERFQPLKVWELNSWIPLRVMDVPASAGFYASVWGSLPYAITRHPLERFELYRVK